MLGLASYDDFAEMKVLMAIICLLLGLMMCAAGYRAMQTGEMIPPARKRGPMISGQAMFGGIPFLGAGAIWTWMAVRQRK